MLELLSAFPFNTSFRHYVPIWVSVKSGTPLFEFVIVPEKSVISG
jgi:hypothetical protein